MVTGNESYSSKRIGFEDAFTQFPDTQGPNQGTQAVQREEAATTADGAEGQWSSSPWHGRQVGDRQTLVAAKETGTAMRDVMKVKEPAQKEARQVEDEPQNPLSGGRQLQKSRGSEEVGVEEQQQDAVRAFGSHSVGNRSQDAGSSNKRRHEEEVGTSDAQQARKRRRGEDQQGEEESRISNSLELPAVAGLDVVGAFAERMMKGLLDLVTEHGVAASMTVTPRGLSWTCG
jgi:hypothetical protein